MPHFTREKRPLLCIMHVTFYRTSSTKRVSCKPKIAPRSTFRKRRSLRPDRMRPTRSALAFAGLVVLATFACNAPPAARAPVKEEQFVLSEDARDGGDDSSGADRVVFPEPDSGNYFHGYWRVSDEDAERADEGVADYLRGERPEIAA